MLIRKFTIPLLLIALVLPSAAQTKSRPAAKSATQAAAQKKFFPYEIQHRKYPNGLNVVVIRTPEFKDMVTYATAVLAGSRNETQKGKTGLAHLFEHIMFLHEYGGKANGYDEAIRLMGAHNNAWTNYDMTFYHPTTFTQNLVGPIQRQGVSVPGLIDLESSRFKDLKVDQKTFQVQAGAVLGEYRRVFSFPQEKMLEVFSPLAFPSHPYGHTVIGYSEDVENMPNAWDAAWEFYHNYYAPNDVAIIAVGDVDPNLIFEQVEKYYADWKPTQVPAIPPEQQPTKEQVTHVSWDADVSPQLDVAYHTPAMRPGTKESAVTMLLPELLTSRSAPLYQLLRYKKQSVTSLDAESGQILQATDPHLLMIEAELTHDRFNKDGVKYVNEVRDNIISGVEGLKSFSKQGGAANTLQVIKSKVRNDFLGSLDSTGNIAEIFGEYFRFNRDPNVFEELMQALDSLTPADIDAYAQKYFTANRRVITTLWKGEAPAAKPAQEAK